MALRYDPPAWSSVGTYDHAENEVAIVMKERHVPSELGVRMEYKETWIITGFLKAASQAALTTAISGSGGLEEAYGVNGGDLTFRLTTGGTETSHSMKTSATLGSVRVVGLEYPKGTGVEYAPSTGTPGRTYRITVESDVSELNTQANAATSDTDIISWNETIEAIGVGDSVSGEFVLLQPLTGLPIKQYVNQRTPVAVIQRGHAVGYTTWPTVNDPMLGTIVDSHPSEHQSRRKITRRSPRHRGYSQASPPAMEFSHYPIEWFYFFEDPDFQTFTPLGVTTNIEPDAVSGSDATP